MHIRPIDLRATQVSKQFHDSILETGFAVIGNHGIDIDLMECVLVEWRTFFASNYKMDYMTKTRESDSGYIPLSISETAQGYTEKDIKEYYHHRINLPLPRHMSEVTEELLIQLLDLSKKLLGYLDEHLPPEYRHSAQSLQSMVGSTESVMRILHYPPLSPDIFGNKNSVKVRAAAHTDINLITLLLASKQPGLELLAKDGSWIPVPMDPGQLAINIGMQVSETTKKYYKSTVHRVVNPIDVNEARYSIPFFTHAADDVQLSPRYTAKSMTDWVLGEIYK
jgi:isopenicillin N synthase-like dioxygenase